MNLSYYTSVLIIATALLTGCGGGGDSGGTTDNSSSSEVPAISSSSSSVVVSSSNSSEISSEAPASSSSSSVIIIGSSSSSEVSSEPQSSSSSSSSAVVSSSSSSETSSEAPVSSSSASSVGVSSSEASSSSSVAGFQIGDIEYLKNKTMELYRKWNGLTDIRNVNFYFNSNAKISTLDNGDRVVYSELSGSYLLGCLGKASSLVIHENRDYFCMYIDTLDNINAYYLSINNSGNINGDWTFAFDSNGVLEIYYDPDGSAWGQLHVGQYAVALRSTYNERILDSDDNVLKNTEISTPNKIFGENNLRDRLQTFIDNYTLENMK